MKTEQEIIDEVCKPYGGFVNVINKCGGTLVSQLWIKSMQQYAQLSEAREATTYSDSDCVDIAFDFGYGCDIPKGDKNQESVHGAAVWGLIKMRDLLSTQKPEEGKEPDNTLNCNCTSDRQTPMINGKHICSICNKPLY